MHIYMYMYRYIYIICIYIYMVMTALYCMLLLVQHYVSYSLYDTVSPRPLFVEELANSVQQLLSRPGSLEEEAFDGFGFGM